jgi:hypothetical protein
MKARKIDEDSGNDMISFPPDEHEKPRKEFTCFTCECATLCDYAWDWYNLNGDCLMMK